MRILHVLILLTLFCLSSAVKPSTIVKVLEYQYYGTVVLTIWYSSTHYMVL